VTGGGKWETFDGTNTESGTYTVIGLVSWQFASLQPPGSAIDLIDPSHERANGHVILRIRFSVSGMMTGVKVSSASGVMALERQPVFKKA
jgi:hypothetical protein